MAVFPEKTDALVHYLKSIQVKDKDWEEEHYDDMDVDEYKTFGELYFDYIKRYSTEKKRTVRNKANMDEEQVVLLFNKSDLENYGIKLVKFDSVSNMVEIR